MVNRYHELSRMEGKAECYPCLFVGDQNVWFGLTELECGVRGVPFHIFTLSNPTLRHCRFKLRVNVMTLLLDDTSPVDGRLEAI